MVDLSGGIRTSFRGSLELFCKENNLSIKYGKNMGEYTYYVIGGEIIDIDNMIKYIEKLEKDRKDFRMTKSFLWRIFN